MARHPLSPLDAAWLHMDAPNNPMVITAVLWLRESLGVDAFRAIVQTRLVDRFPRFAQRIVEPPLGPPHWADDPGFDLAHHVGPLELPAPGGRAALQALVAQQMSTPLDRTRAPWAFDVVDGYRGGSAVICRIHHCIADGISLARVLLQLADDPPTLPGRTPPVPEAPTVDADAAPLDPGDLERAPTDLLEALGWGAEAVLEAERLLFLPADPPTVLRRPLTPRKVAAWSDPLPLEAVKEVGRRTRTTVNDVLVAVLAAALHEHLVAEGTPADQVRAFVPVNMRPLDQPIPRALGNQFSIVVLPLPVGPQAPTDRLAEVHRHMHALKTGTQVGVVWALLHVMGASPTPIERLIVDIMGRKGSLIVTNVPGPTHTLRLAGVPLEGVLVFVPQSGDVGLGVSILSYAGEVTIGLCGDADTLPDPDALVKRFVNAWEALRDAV